MSELHDDIRKLNKEVENLETRIEELEQQKAELIEFLHIVKRTSGLSDINDYGIYQLFNESIRLLKKHGVEI